MAEPANSTVLMWSPKPIVNSNIRKFIQILQEKRLILQDIDSYADLYNWSLGNISDFWACVWDFANVKYQQNYNTVIDESLTITDLPKWFDGALFNYAENILHWDDDHVALYAANEVSDTVKQVTYSELKELVRRYASAMKRYGVVTGDRVVGYIPNCIEAVAAMLATSSIGAIWSSTSPDFGVHGVLDRFSQISPKIIFSTNCVKYNGKMFSHIDKLKQVVEGLSGIEKVVVIKYIDDVDLDIAPIPKSCWLDEFLADGADDSPLTFTPLPFSHPLYIMYSSGTTGAPKCMVHSQGGTLMKHLEEHMLQGNASRSDIMLYYTTTGWMMWNWMIGLLAVGGTCVLYDGSPLIPSPNILWDLVDKLNITVLGTGAKWLAVLEDKNMKPAETHKLTSLHTILSTGSPLKPTSYDYVYKHVKADVLLGSITGGTDIIGLFAGHTCTLPVYRGEIQTRVLGCAIECWDEGGNSVYGQSGELVVTKPFPSMPVFFWNDPDGSKYKKAYFCKYPGVWSHGDYCLINPATGGILMLGRSDGTLNPNGVRFGSAEIYSIVESQSEIQDSLCVAQRNQDKTEERVILFLKMANGYHLNEMIIKSLQNKIREELSARHVPSLILETKEIPYTVSGKKVEVAVRDMIAGLAITHRAAYSNPDSLDLYANIPELQGY